MKSLCGEWKGRGQAMREEAPVSTRQETSVQGLTSAQELRQSPSRGRFGLAARKLRWVVIIRAGPTCASTCCLLLGHGWGTNLGRINGSAVSWGGWSCLLTAAESSADPCQDSMSELERETEEDEGGSTSDTAPMLPRRPTDHQTSGLATQGLRTLLLLGQALAWLLLHLLLPGMVFLLVLLPAVVVVYLGFLCHSRVHPAPGLQCRALLSDRGSAALIVLGFLLLPPLLVLASTARARLLRRLRPLLSPLAWTPWLPGPNGEEQLCAWV